MRTNRRTLLIGGLAVCAVGVGPSMAAGPVVAVTKDPDCGCCGAWIAHIRKNGFSATVTETRDVATVKARLGVPAQLASCHTAEVAGYVVEGHVPADALKRLLAEKPEALGLAVPGMPIGSPGMEGGTPEVYEVVLFGRDGRTSVYGRYRGDKRLTA
jgi:hypothetical protein